MQHSVNVKGLKVAYEFDAPTSTLTYGLHLRQFSSKEDCLRFHSALGVISQLCWDDDSPASEFGDFLYAQIAELFAVGFLKKGPDGWHVSQQF